MKLCILITISSYACLLTIKDYYHHIHLNADCIYTAILSSLRDLMQDAVDPANIKPFRNSFKNSQKGCLAQSQLETSNPLSSEMSEHGTTKRGFHHTAVTQRQSRESHIIHLNRTPTGRQTQ